MTSPTVEQLLNEALPPAVVPLVAVASTGEWHPVGTAFVVAVVDPRTAFLLTAAHNIQHVLRLENPRAIVHPTAIQALLPAVSQHTALKRTSIYALVTDPPPAALAGLEMGWGLAGHDIVLLLVRIPDAYQARFVTRLAIDSGPVDEGSDLVVVGYPGMGARFTEPPDYEKQHFKVGFNLQLQARRGRVIETLPQGSGIHRWPGFRLDCAIDSGMSGGPIIDFARHTPTVRGVAGGDITESAVDGRVGSGVRAFGSALWPALATPLQLDIRFEGEPLVRRAESLLDLIRHGVLEDHGNAPHHIEVEVRGGETLISWRS